MAPVIIMLGVVVVAILSLVVVGAAAWLTWRRAQTGEVGRSVVPSEQPRPQTSRIESDGTAHEPASPDTFDRVVRVLTLIFLASVGVAVFVTGAYAQTAVAIELLIAAALLTVVLLQDILPTAGAGRLRHWVEAVAATVFVALLTGLTGGASSPFFVGFLLIVAGASLSLDETAPLLIALLSGACFALVVVLVTDPNDFFSLLPVLAFDLVILALLAYLASVVAREQRRAREAALSLSRFDPLTGLYNRSYFFSMLDRELRRSARTGSRFAVVMFDLDDLKPVNDTYGHPIGDELIRAITDVVRRNVRSTDVAARFGGDEFIILLADTDSEGAFIVAEKLRADVAALAVGPADRPARSSASFGLVTYPEDGGTIEALIQNADDAMYQSKRSGKNQIVGYRTRTERIATQFRPGSAESNEARYDRSDSVRRTREMPPSGTAPSGMDRSGTPPPTGMPPRTGTPPVAEASAPASGQSESASSAWFGRSSKPSAATRRTATLDRGGAGTGFGREAVAVPVEPVEPPASMPETRFAPPGTAPWDSTAATPRTPTPRP